MMDAGEIATALRALADRVERLPSHDRRNPHAFSEGKFDLATDLIGLADALTARADPPPAPCSVAGLPHRHLRRGAATHRSRSRSA